MEAEYHLTKYMQFATIFSPEDAGKFQMENTKFMSDHSATCHPRLFVGNGRCMLYLVDTKTGKELGFVTDKKPEDLIKSGKISDYFNEKIKMAINMVLSVSVSIFGLLMIDDISKDPLFILGIIFLIISLVTSVSSIFHDANSVFSATVDELIGQKNIMVEKFKKSKLAFKASMFFIGISLVIYLIRSLLNFFHWFFGWIYLTYCEMYLRIYLIGFS